MLRCRVKVATINPLFGRVSAMSQITIFPKAPVLLAVAETSH
jgi:hypothetical protein